METNSWQRKKGSVSKDKRYPWLKVPTPTHRALQVYAFDPSTGGYAGNSTTVHVLWESSRQAISICNLVFDCPAGTARCWSG